MVDIKGAITLGDRMIDKKAGLMLAKTINGGHKRGHNFKRSAAGQGKRSLFSLRPET